MCWVSPSTLEYFWVGAVERLDLPPSSKQSHEHHFISWICGNNLPLWKGSPASLKSNLPGKKADAWQVLCHRWLLDDSRSDASDLCYHSGRPWIGLNTIRMQWLISFTAKNMRLIQNSGHGLCSTVVDFWIQTWCVIIRTSGFSQLVETLRPNSYHTKFKSTHTAPSLRSTQILISVTPKTLTCPSRFCPSFTQVILYW